jgi:hypothetical protein
MVLAIVGSLSEKNFLRSYSLCTTGGSKLPKRISVSCGAYGAIYGRTMLHRTAVCTEITVPVITVPVLQLCTVQYPPDTAVVPVHVHGLYSGVCIHTILRSLD